MPLYLKGKLQHFPDEVFTGQGMSRKKKTKPFQYNNLGDIFVSASTIRSFMRQKHALESYYKET